MIIEKAIKWTAGIAALFLLLQNPVHSWYEPKHPLENLRIRCIAPDDEYVWFGSSQHGAFRYHKPTGTWETFCQATVLPRNGIASIEAYPDSVIVYNWEGGMVYHKPPGEWNPLKGYQYRSLPPRRQVSVGRHTYEIRGDSLMRIEGTDTTLFRVPDGLVTSLLKITDHRLNRIFHDDDKLWFGLSATDDVTHWFGQGILCFDLAVEAWRHFSPKPLKYYEISCIANDGDFLWFGTAGFTEFGPTSGAGALQYDKTTGEWRQFSTKNSGIPGDAVLAITINGEGIWFGTDHGIGRYEKSTEKWRRYGITDWELVGLLVNVYAGRSPAEKPECAVIGRLQQGLKPILLSKQNPWYEIRLDKPVPGWIPRDRIEVKKDSAGNEYGVWKFWHSRSVRHWDGRVKKKPGNQYPNLCYPDDYERLTLGREQDGWQEILLPTGWIKERYVKCLISEIP